jgi:hypothetical protein
MNNIQQLYFLFRTYRMLYRCSKLDNYKCLSISILNKMRELKFYSNVVFIKSKNDSSITNILAA